VTLCPRAVLESGAPRKKKEAHNTAIRIYTYVFIYIRAQHCARPFIYTYIFVYVCAGHQAHNPLSTRSAGVRRAAEEEEGAQHRHTYAYVYICVNTRIYIYVYNTARALIYTYIFVYVCAGHQAHNPLSTRSAGVRRPAKEEEGAELRARRTRRDALCLHPGAPTRHGLYPPTHTHSAKPTNLGSIQSVLHENCCVIGSYY